MVFDVSPPVFPGMRTGPLDVIVSDVSLKQFLMEIPVDLVEKVARSAFDHQSQIAVLQRIDHVENRIRIPIGLICSLFTQQSFQIPVVWKGPNVHATAQATHLSKQIPVPDGQVQRPRVRPSTNP